MASWCALRLVGQLVFLCIVSTAGSGLHSCSDSSVPGASLHFDAISVPAAADSVTTLPIQPPDDPRQLQFASCNNFYSCGPCTAQDACIWCSSSSSSYTGYCRPVSGCGSVRSYLTPASCPVECSSFVSCRTCVASSSGTCKWCIDSRIAEGGACYIVAALWIRVPTKFSSLSLQPCHGVPLSSVILLISGVIAPCISFPLLQAPARHSLHRALAAPPPRPRVHRQVPSQRPLRPRRRLALRVLVHVAS